MEGRWNFIFGIVVLKVWDMNLKGGEVERDFRIGNIQKSGYVKENSM